VHTQEFGSQLLDLKAELGSVGVSNSLNAAEQAMVDEMITLIDRLLSKSDISNDDRGDVERLGALLTDLSQNAEHSLAKLDFVPEISKKV
jgi:ribosome assembly protein YihI (activator of Der GTPase)